MKKVLLLLLLAQPVFPTGFTKNPQGPPGPQGPAGPQGPQGIKGDDGTHAVQMPLGAGVRWFDTDHWQGVTSYQFDPIHQQNTLSGLVIYKLGPDATQARIDALNAKIDALNRILERKPTEEKPVKGVIWGNR